MKKKEKNIFIATIAFMLIALALMVTFNFVSFYKNSVSNMESIGTNALNAEISEINNYLIQGIQTLKITSDNVDYMLSQDITPDEIEQYMKFETNRFASVTDKSFGSIYGCIHGQYVDGVDRSMPANYDPTKEEWYTTAVNGSGYIVNVSPYVDKDTGDVIITVCRLLDDGESVISIDISMNQVQKITEENNLNNMGYTFIVDGNDFVIAHSDSEKAGTVITDHETKEIIDSPLKNQYVKTKMHGEKIYIFTGQTDNYWRVFTVISRSKLLKSARDVLIRNILIVIVVYAAVIFFSIFAFRKMRESMDELNRKQKQVENANKNLEHSKNIITNLAYTNILTDLKNRYSLDNDIKNRLESDYIGIAYFDIDNFRNINETFGYDFGDSLLSAIAGQLTGKFSKYAEIYQIFGNQFCLVFNNDITAEKAVDITIEAFETIRDKYLIGNIYVQPIVSGTTYRCSPKEFASSGALLLKLESIVREIKRNGGNFCNTNIN